MNIILKAFGTVDYQTILKAAFQGRSIGKCISINNYNLYTPDIDAKEHEWIPSKLLRQGEYPDVDWSTITPLDEELIENMRLCESMFLSMLDRYALRGEISYAERKRQYFAHLRFWNHTLEKENIGLFVLNHPPHQCYDYVMYELCKLKGIPTYHVERCYSVNSVFFVKDYEISADQLVPAYAKLHQEYAQTDKPIELSPSYEAFYESQTTTVEKPWFTGERGRHLTKKNFLMKWSTKSLELLRHKPRQLIRSILSVNTWSRKLAQHRTSQLYDKHCTEPDFSKPYIYLPLHMQPEETTSPRGGAFVNQELIVQLLAAHLPPEVQIYVKEHPAQGELCRNEKFYQSMIDIPSVKFMPRSSDTFALTKHAKAIATVTGTAGLEALFRQIPVLMFGHRFYQYAPGVHRISTSDDCRDAIESIFQKNETPSLRDVRIFLKATQEEGSDYLMDPTLSPEEVALQKTYFEKAGNDFHKIMTPLFS